MNLFNKLNFPKQGLLLWVLTFLALWAPLTAFGQPFDKTVPLKSQATTGIFDDAFPSSQYFPVVPARFTSGGMNDNPASLNEPEYFPYQNAQTSNDWACPVILNNGEILLIWNDQDNLVFSRSTDGGLSWENPGLIATTPGYIPDQLSGIYSQDNVVVIIWRDTQILELMMSSSVNNGVDWSPPAQITFSERNEVRTILSQTLDGTLWLFYACDVPGNARDIFYRTSSDNGVTWSSEQTFLATPDDDAWATVISADQSTLLAFYQDNSTGDLSIYQVSSSDGGQNWSSPTAIGQVYLDEGRPLALRQSDGTLWVIYIGITPTPALPGVFQQDIYSITSTTQGNLWSQPQIFTQYIGFDGTHSAALLNDQPFVTFISNRWANWNQNQIWYGIIGETEDNNPPPALFNYYVISPDQSQNSLVTLRAVVDDESGISGVSGSYNLNGVPSGTFAMYDDGSHNDLNAGDNIWAGQIGPFQVGDNIDFSYHITDISNNTVDPHVSSIGIPVAHAAGNVILSWHQNSGLAEGSSSVWGSSAFWPVTDGQDYLFSGGLWVGAQISGEPRVMHYYFGESDWQPTPGTFYGMVPGPADQVGKVTYDDQQALSAPIGLQVTQRSYQWSSTDPDHDDFIMIRYTIKNTGNDNLDGVSVGLWTDPDLSLQTSPPGAADDLGKYEADRKLAYLYDSQNNPGGYFGIKLLGGSQPHTVNIAPNGGILDNQDDNTRYFSMWTGPQPDPTTPADYRILMTHAMNSLAAGDSQTVAFGIVLGNGAEELRANADAMELRYAQLFGTQVPPENLFAIDKLDGQVPLYWNPGNEPGSTLLSYNVYRTDSPSPIGNVPWDQPHFMDTNIDNGQVYSYYVTAVYNTGESDPSNETIGYPMSLPDEPGKTVSYARPGGRPYGIVFDGNHIWMADYYSNQINQYDPVTWQWTGQIPAPEGGGSYGLAWDGTSLWVANLGSGLYQIDISGNILQYINVQPGTATGVAYENGHVWTLDRANGVVYEYAAASGQLLQTFPFPDFQGATPRGLAYLPDRGTFIVGVTPGNNYTRIYEMNASDFTFTGREFDFGMEYDPGNGEFYSSVRGVAYNPLTGNYWLGDVRTDVVYEVMPFTSQNDITFRVNMNVKMQQQLFQPANGDMVVVRGNFNGWSGNDAILEDSDSDNIYSGTYNVGGSAGDEIQYKFVISYPGGGVLWEDNIPNRSFILTGNPATLPVVFFDNDPGQGLLVTNTNDSGPGSLREAIDIANNDGQPSIIEFDPALMVQTILPESELPALIEDNTTINGDIDDDGTPDIEITSEDWREFYALVIESAYNTIRGLVINNFHNDNVGRVALVIRGGNAHHNSIVGCYIGTDMSGTSVMPNRNGIMLSEGAHANIIGGATAADRNVISGNHRIGIYLVNENTYDNTILGNYIGVDVSGENPLSNRDGIILNNGASYNLIGGGAPGDGNIIWYNREEGIEIIGGEFETRSNRIVQNSISQNGRKGISLRDNGNYGIAPPDIHQFDGSVLRGRTIPDATVEIFADELNQGAQYLGTVQSDGEGNFEFDGTFPGTPFYNATVTDGGGSTSEFSFSRIFIPVQQTEINANHWRVQLPNDGRYSQDIKSILGGNGAGGEFPKNSNIYILYSAGQYLGTLKNGTPSVSQMDHRGNDFAGGKILNQTPAPIEALVWDDFFAEKNRVYVIDSTRMGNDWDNWPAEDGAPVDANGDPLLISKQDSWIVFNDLISGLHSGSGDPVLGVEIQRSTYSYTFPGAASDVFFVKWKIVNKSLNDYPDTYFGAWFDPDVDGATEDLAGTDTSLNMAFFYNSDNNEAPEAFGAWLAKGPVANGQPLGLTATATYNNGEDLNNDDERYNMLRGMDRWGNEKPYGPYDFIGDPLTQMGHLDWNPADKRLLLSSGPFTLYVGNVQEVVVACIGAVGNDRLDAIAKLRETTRQVQEFYHRPMLSISQTQGVAKYKTPVYVSLNRTNGFLGADIKVNYNNSYLEIAANDIALTPLTAAFIKSVNVQQDQGMVSVALVASNPVEENLADVFLKLPFKVKNNTPAGSVSELLFTEAVLTFQSDSLTEMVPAITNGSLKVVEGVLFGDVNQNGTFDLIDGVLCLKALVEVYDEITPFQELLADYNKNGKLQVDDATQILNQLVLNKSAGSNGGMIATTIADTAVDLNLQFPPIQGGIGEEARIPVRVESFEQLYGLELLLGYDSRALKLETIEQTGSTDMLISNLKFPGRAHLAIANTEGIGNPEDELVYLTFKVLQAGEHLISVEKSFGVPSAEELAELLAPKAFKLTQNYPNPFNPTTTIQYQLPKPAKVVLEIFNVRGQRVATLVNEEKAAGYYSVVWDAREVSSGVYFYRIKAGEFTDAKKLIVIK